MTSLKPSDALDPQTILAHARPGPRYTSYPTVPVWTEAVDGASFAERLQRGDKADAPLSLYYHLPFCRQRCHFCGCNVVITAKQDKADRYIDYLEKEMDLVGSFLASRRGVSQLHFGGGTPTFLKEAQLVRLWRAITSRFHISDDAELAIEVDPSVTTREQIALLRGFGFNRMSFGVQDFTPAVQQQVGRIQSVETTRDLYDYARALGYQGINFDLIYGLPLQVADEFAQTIDKVIELRPDRIALFSYAHVPWLHPQQKKMDESRLPGPLLKVQLYQLARAALLEAGYVAIGMDHFAVPEDELAAARLTRSLGRNFQGYTARPRIDTVAFGVSAISDIADSYAQNVKTIIEYYRKLDEGSLPVERGWRLTDDDILRRDVIHRIMCNFFVDLKRAAADHGVEPDRFSEALEALAEAEAQELLKRDGWTLEALPLGQVLIRNIAMAFDAYLEPKSEKRQVFSQTV